MSVKDGLLALLVRSDGYGYQLKADFEEATGGAWTLNIGQVYTSLQRLERDGLVEEVDGSDPDRRSYRATAKGREQLDAWLGQPEARTVEARDEVAMKVLMAAATPGRDPHVVIAAQRTATMQALQEHTRRKAALREGSLAQVVHLDRIILMCRAELDWLDLTEARLDSQHDASRNHDGRGTTHGDPAAAAAATNGHTDIEGADAATQGVAR